MKRILACIIFLLCPDTAFAEAEAENKLSGHVIDRETRVSMPSVSITIVRQSDNSVVTGALTNQDGRFEIDGLETGEYLVNLRFLGHDPVDMPLLIGERNTIYSLGTVALSRSTALMNELVITADRYEEVSVAPGVNVFRMDNNVARAGGSLLEALRGLPGVTVDQEGHVLLRGSDKVAILMDGKQSSLTGYGRQAGLDSIPANNIDRIEIINNPSSRYDASGMAGVINIIYKQDKELGLHGDVGLTLGLGTLSRRAPDLPTDLGSYARNPKAIPSLNLNYNTEDWDTYLQAESFFRRALPNNEFTTRYYDDGREIRSQVPENRHQIQHVVKAGADWRADDNDTLSFSSIFDREHHRDRAEVPFIDAATMQRLRFWFWTEQETTGYLNFTSNFKHEFGDAGHELKFGAQYTRGWEDESYYLNEVSPIRTGTDETHLHAVEHTIPVTLDYVRPMKSGRLEAGAKLQIRRLPIDYDVVRGPQSVIYPGLGDTSKWGENIYAGYLNYVHEKRSYAVEAGIRVEQTDVFYNLPPENIYYPRNDSYSYLRLFPNVRLTYKLDDRTDISAFYNRRIDRPGEPELRIFPKYDDPELLKVGNPYLRPQDTESVEASIKTDWSTGTISTALYHRMIDNPFQRVFTIDSTNATYDIVNRIYTNVGHATNTGLELLLTQEVSDFLEISGSVNWYRIRIAAFDTTLLFPTVRPFSILASKDDTWNAKINGQFTLSKGLKAQLGLIYYANKNIPQGTEAARASLDFGVSKSFLNDRAEVTLSATDIFNTFGIKQRLVGDGFTALYRNYYETQQVSLGVKYKF
jgi:outer membrane receptor protein involved in Fe transport